MNRLPHGLSNGAPARLALSLLYANARKARELLRCPWEYSVRLGDLLLGGLTPADVGLLAGQGFLEGRPALGGGGTEFLLTPAGEALVESFGRPPGAPAAPVDDPRPVRPRWDEAGQAVWAEVLVKRLAPQSRHEAPLLRALAERSWTEGWVEAPPGLGCGDPKACLRDALRTLNCGLRGRLLTFEHEHGSRRFHWRSLTR